MDPLFLVTTTMIRRAITPANSTIWIYVGLSGSHWVHPVHPVLQRFAMKLDQTFSDTNAPDLNLNSIGVVMREPRSGLLKLCTYVAEASSAIVQSWGAQSIDVSRRSVGDGL
jgi:hypothetical protein